MSDINKSWKIPHNLVIETLPRQGLITGYNSLSATSDLKMADYDIPVYPGTMRYNPQVKDHGIIIGCLIFRGLLMMFKQVSMPSPLPRVSVNKPPLVTFIVLSNFVGADSTEDWKIGVRSFDVRMQIDEKAVILVIHGYLRVGDGLTSRIGGFPRSTGHRS